MTSELGWHSACGKVILFGEHAVVYGIKAVAAGIPNAVKARARLQTDGILRPVLTVAAWGLSVPYDQSAHSPAVHDQAPDNQALDNQACDNQNGHADLLARTFRLIVDTMKVADKPFVVELVPNIPAASGLGASAAIAVATIRAISGAFDLNLSNEQINAIAYRCEQLAHGNPSGLDNTLAVYGGLLEFQRHQDEVRFSTLSIATPFDLVVAHSGKMGFTAEMVAQVRQLRQQQPDLVAALFRRIDDVREQGVGALIAGNMDAFAQSLNANHRCLVELGVSCEEIEHVVEVSLECGASGAKLTGSGGGGAVILTSQQSPSLLCSKLESAGIKALPISVGV